MSDYAEKLLELLSLEKTSDNYFLHVRYFDRQNANVVLWIKIDGYTAKSLESAVQWEERQKYRLSFTNTWDIARKQYTGTVTRTCCEQSHPIPFLCTEDYTGKIAALKNCAHIGDLAESDFVFAEPGSAEGQRLGRQVLEEQIAEKQKAEQKPEIGPGIKPKIGPEENPGKGAEGKGRLHEKGWNGYRKASGFNRLTNVLIVLLLVFLCCAFISKSAIDGQAYTRTDLPNEERTLPEEEEKSANPPEENNHAGVREDPDTILSSDTKGNPAAGKDPAIPDEADAAVDAESEPAANTMVGAIADTAADSDNHADNTEAAYNTGVSDNAEAGKKGASQTGDTPAVPCIELEETVTYGLSEGNVAITFDDGPSPYSAGIVDILKEYEVGGTFFFIGYNVERYPEAVQYVYRNGYSIGSHSMDHAKMTNLSQEKQEYEMIQSMQSIEDITKEPVNLFRAPFGSFNEQVVDLATEHQYKLVLWNNDPQDWKTRNADQILLHIQNTELSGSIILLHESQAVVDALPRVIEYIREQDLEMVSLK